MSTSSTTQPASAEPWLPLPNPLRVDVLGAALGTLAYSVGRWAVRDQRPVISTDSVPHPRAAVNQAVAAIDEMVRELHALRSQLITEMRRYDDETDARVDALLARKASDR